MTGHLVEYIVREVIANCELEGITVDIEWREMLTRLATGEITADEAIHLTIERYQPDNQD